MCGAALPLTPLLLLAFYCLGAPSLTACPSCGLFVPLVAAALAAGLRGELRKYTDLALAFEGQLRQQQGQEGVTHAVHSVKPPAVAASAPPAAPTPTASPDKPGAGAAAAAQGDAASAAGKPAAPAVPYAQQQGLELDKRLSLYKEILSSSMFMATNVMKEEMQVRSLGASQEPLCICRVRPC